MKINGEGKTPSLSSPVLFAVLAISLMGLDFLDLPFDAARLCGASGYWTVLGAFVLAALPLIFLAGAMQRRFPHENLLQAAELVLGRPLALVGNLIFLATFAAWLVFAIRDSADLILSYLLNRTPLWAVIVAIIVAVGYVAVNGLVPAARLASFLVIPAVAIRLAMQIFSLQGLEVTHLEPIFSATPLAYLWGGLALANFFMPITVLMLIHPILQRPSKLQPVALGAASVALVSFFLGAFAAIGIFGARYTQYFTWSELATVHRIGIIYLVLEQVGLSFVIVWITMFCTAITIYLSVVARGLVQQFTRLNYRWVALGLVILIGAAALAFSSAIHVHETFTLLRRWAIVPAAGYPLVVFVVACLREKRGTELAA